jgi:NAD(P)-dependent dehydrogenase (short-subunit alcohol dehydrogenase family)
VHDIRARGGDARAEPADLRRDEDAGRVVTRCVEHYGRLDLLANCAGRSGRSAVVDTTPADFQRLWELNFLATVRLSRAAVPELRRTRGHLVNIGSLATKVAPRYLGAYPASKFPLAAYCQQLRLELGGEGLHVLLVCPGPIARDDAGARYTESGDGVPESARKPGGGARIRAIDPVWLAKRIMAACERRKVELIVPRKARALFVVTQLSPRLGDWLLKKMT